MMNHSLIEKVIDATQLFKIEVSEVGLEPRIFWVKVERLNH